MTERMEGFVIRCPKHPNYTGLRKDRHKDCPHCAVVRRGRGATFRVGNIDGLQLIARWGAR